MNKPIEPTIQNHDLIKQVIEMRIKESMQQRFPTAEELLEELK